MGETPERPYQYPRPFPARRFVAFLAVAILVIGVVSSILNNEFVRCGTDGCGPLGFDSMLSFWNLTDERLTFTLNVGSDRHVIANVPPGQNQLYGLASNPEWLDHQGCTTGDVVAQSEDGTEVARHAPPMCKGAEWVVTPPMPPAATSAQLSPSP